MTKNIVAFIYEPYDSLPMYEFKTYTELLDYIKKIDTHPEGLNVLVYSDPVEVPFSFLQGLADEEERGK